MKDFSEHILDLTQNSIRAKATLIEISITESKVSNLYWIGISDNGTGMDDETIKLVTDPYYTSRSTRKVGLGVPLFKHNAELTGGSFQLSSVLGKGTQISADFINNHLDRLPVGDLVGTYLLLIAANPTLNFLITHTTDSGTYIFDTREVKNLLGEIPINDPSVRQFLKEMIQENLEAIGTER
ncbi:MAG: ATP-binding protein [Salinivirgaceae bacterium]